MPFSKIIYNTKIVSDVFNYLEAHPQGASSFLIVKQILKIRNVSRHMSDTIAQTVLTEDPRFVLEGTRWRLRPPPEEKEVPVWSKEYVAVDIETTGSSPPRNRIIEVGAVRIRDGKICEVFESLVNPHQDIPSFIARMTGINASMVRKFPSSEVVLPKFLDFLGDAVFIAHNAPFDSRFLRSECADVLNKIFVNEVLCTLKMARRLHKGQERHNLDTISMFYNVPIPKRHRAMDDAQACAGIFCKMVEGLCERGVETYQQLRLFERTGELKPLAPEVRQGAAG